MPRENLPEHKLLLIGPIATGKTSLLVRYTRDSFSPDACATIFCDYQTALYPHSASLSTLSAKTPEAPIATEKEAVTAAAVVNPTHRLLFLDTAGQERFRALSPAYYRNASGVLLVYDVTNRNSFLDLSSWVDKVWRYTGDKTPIVVVGNKMDCILDGEDAEKHMRLVPPEEAQRWAHEIGAEWAECSAKTGEGVNEAFAMLVEKVIASENPDGKEGRLMGGSGANLEVRSGWVSRGCSC